MIRPVAIFFASGLVSIEIMKYGFFSVLKANQYSLLNLIIVQRVERAPFGLIDQIGIDRIPQGS